MAWVFKRKRKVTDPETGEVVVKKSRKYTVEWKDADGKSHRQTAFTDKAESYALGVKLESEAQTGKLAQHRKTALTAHVKAFRCHLESKRRTEKYIQTTCYRIEQILQGCPRPPLPLIPGAI